MKRRLFLTGPMGCGKSTAIARAVGDRRARFGGFLTGRLRDAQGHAVCFYLESPDGAQRETFLDFSRASPVIRPEVFDTLGLRLLSGPALLLDEIGGIELLRPDFPGKLMEVLSSDTPILGVLKGEGPAGALVRALGLQPEYETAAENLRAFLRNDPDTLLYECGQFDETALQLAINWVKEYCP